MKKTNIYMSLETWNEIRKIKPEGLKLSYFYSELIKKGLEVVKNERN